MGKESNKGGIPKPFKKPDFKTRGKNLGKKESFKPQMKNPQLPKRVFLKTPHLELPKIKV